jgi:hypothetical protein
MRAPFLTSNLVIYQSSMGVRLRRVTTLGQRALQKGLVFLLLLPLLTYFGCANESRLLALLRTIVLHLFN